MNAARSHAGQQTKMRPDVSQPETAKPIVAQLDLFTLHTNALHMTHDVARLIAGSRDNNDFLASLLNGENSSLIPALLGSLLREDEAGAAAAGEALTALVAPPLHGDASIARAKQLAVSLASQLMGPHQEALFACLSSRLANTKTAGSVLRLLQCCCEGEPRAFSVLLQRPMIYRQLYNCLLSEESNDAILLFVSLLDGEAGSLPDGEMGAELLEEAEAILHRGDDAADRGTGGGGEGCSASLIFSAACLLSELYRLGVRSELGLQEVAVSLTKAFPSFTSVVAEFRLSSMRWLPCGRGILDGVIMTLQHIVAQERCGGGSKLLASQLWELLWRCISSTICHADRIDTWLAVSPRPLVALLRLTTATYTAAPFALSLAMGRIDGAVMVAIATMVTEEFLESFDLRCAEVECGDLTCELIDGATRLLCFPFGVDTNDSTLTSLCVCYQYHNVCGKLLNICSKHATNVGLIFKLICRLVAEDGEFANQFASAMNNSKTKELVRRLVGEPPSTSVLSDVLGVLSQLARASPIHLPLIAEVMSADNAGRWVVVLRHHDNEVRARACSLLGNMMKHCDRVYAMLINRYVSVMVTAPATDQLHVHVSTSPARSTQSLFRHALVATIQPQSYNIAARSTQDRDEVVVNFFLIE
ncbi:PREDICTED: serine/threonine-protein kinase 36-like [Priapulus caudatus]|uniref:non-specific serine/threonine protein kinase n=1 Tax=Priapulus caudatus TaxID=37621 RepID=A0ABM1F481_PRICU|nr:PREDICTED: serine/threonine-protein kinase 36-like [Priapulus caudatus]